MAAASVHQPTQPPLSNISRRLSAADVVAVRSVAVVEAARNSRPAAGTASSRSTAAGATTRLRRQQLQRARPHRQLGLRLTRATTSGRRVEAKAARAHEVALVDMLHLSRRPARRRSRLASRAASRRRRAWRRQEMHSPHCKWRTEPPRHRLLSPLSPSLSLSLSVSAVVWLHIVYGVPVCLGCCSTLCLTVACCVEWIALYVFGLLLFVWFVLLLNGTSSVAVLCCAIAMRVCVDRYVVL